MRRAAFMFALLLATAAHAADLGSLVLTIAGGQLSFPRLSPDGRRLAYARGGEVRVAVVATRHTDIVVPARYGALQSLEWSDDQHVVAGYAKTRVTADVIHKRRSTTRAEAAPPPQSIDFCGTTLRATADRDTLTLWRLSGPERLPLATIYPAGEASIDVRRTTPREVIFLARIAPRARPETTNHLLSYDGIRLHAYGIDGLDDASFSADGRRIAVSLWNAAERRIYLYER